MIKERINKPLLINLMKQSEIVFEYKHRCDLETDTDEDLKDLVDRLLMLLNGDSIPELQREISIILTTNKHLLPCSKHQLIWLQETLNKVARMRGGIKN